MHHYCEKFQKFLLEEFGRLFRLYSELEKKESDTNDKLVCALEKCDSLDYEVQKLRQELAECHEFDF
jgi:hypothetical protein